MTEPWAERRIVTVLQPSDEYTHVPDESPNYNESMYLNGFDLEREVGGWFRLGNRINEGYAEMTVCLYLPGGRVGFMYQRPRITTNNRRVTPDGDHLVTRITEAMTRYRCGTHTGIGTSECLDQIVDGRPIGPDVTT